MLSPILFAIYTDDLLKRLQETGVSCHIIIIIIFIRTQTGTHNKTYFTGSNTIKHKAINNHSVHNISIIEIYSVSGMIYTLLSLALHISRIAIPVHLLIMDVSFIMYF